MKIVVNECYGGFSVSEWAAEKLNLESRYEADRTDTALIALIEEYGAEKVNGDCADLVIAEIPEEATDWTVNEYDGQEELLYVINGKIQLWHNNAYWN